MQAGKGTPSRVLSELFDTKASGRTTHSAYSGYSESVRRVLKANQISGWIHRDRDLLSIEIQIQLE